MASAVLGRGPGDSHGAERLAAAWHSGLVANDQARPLQNERGMPAVRSVLLANKQREPCHVCQSM